MKTLLSISLLALLSVKAQSQVYVQGGVNLANISKTSSGQTEKNNLLTTFNAGILGRFGLSKTIDLESGLLLDGRGAKAATYFTSGTDDNYVKTKFNPLYLELPLNLVVRIPLEKTTNLFFHGGPYAAIGIAGNSKSDAKFLGVSSSSTSSIKFSNDDPFTSEQDDAAYDKLKRFDFGLNVGGGFDLGKVLLKVNYSLGLTKINSTQSNNSADNKNKYRTVSISLGIPLDRK
ncbi:MAG: PorT family protein [Bacteroidota bacterium]|nr:PorT family protein [Bacteroidota bacterium]